MKIDFSRSYRNITPLVLLIFFALSQLACENKTSSGKARQVTSGDAGHAEASTADTTLTRTLERLVTEHPPTSAGDESYLDGVQTFYRDRNYAPAWITDGDPRPVAEALLEALRQSDRHGLVASDYRLERLNRSMADLSESPSAEAVAETDVLMSLAFVEYAHDLHGGRISPDHVDPRWTTQLPPFDAASYLQRTLQREAVKEGLEQLGPSHAWYDRLVEALSTYRGIEEQGGWPAVPEGTVIGSGDTSARVIPLRERLAATGDLSPSQASARDSVYDDTLARAVYHFQQRHGIATDSLLGPETVAALNVPIEERIRTIELNLERWRWLPDDLGERHVLVNIPAFRLWAYEDGTSTLEMEVIVGSEFDGRATPVFADSMEYLIFSPYWNIPPTIANEEILPKARGDRSYLTDNGYQIVSHYGPDATVFDPYTTDLSRVASGELRLRQRPGPQNALGRVKFMFPNRYAVYLHDTPADHLFADYERAFSHGCIRVEKPVDLAAFSLENKSGWTRSRIHDAMHNGEWQQVELDAHIPVYILYLTAFVDDAGTIHFRRDLYGHDETLDQALARNGA